MILVRPILEYARRNHGRYLSELKEFLAIPSVSALSEHKADIRHAAEWLTQEMTKIGLRGVEIIPTAGHPVAYGEWLDAPRNVTILIYGHYDVQPVDPINEWTSPPFEPTVRDNDIFARGASDMKGQVHAVLKAIEAWLKNGGLPVNVKILFEGEEEISSPNLGPFIEQHKDKLTCDFVLNADSLIMKPDVPSLVYGLRGLVCFELWVQGPKSDLHSGLFGGSVHNPAQVLCELIAGMHDKDGRVTLPGFYEKVRILSAEERTNLSRVPQYDEGWREMTGVPQLYGETGYSTIERIGGRPTLEVNGLLSGFTSEGFKTVLPAKAMAKISTRLVPYQDEKDIEGQLREYMRKNAPPTVKWEVRKLASGPAALVDRNTPAMRAASAAMEATFGVKPTFKLEGGSVPVVSLMKDTLGVNSVLMGFGLPDDNFHAPNEKLHLPNYYRGIETYIRFIKLVGEQE